MMRALILIPMMLLPLTGCMTQRDQTIWAEFKAEISGSPAADATKEAVQTPAK